MPDTYSTFYNSDVDGEDQGIPAGLAWLSLAAEQYGGDPIVIVPGLRQLSLLPAHPFATASGGTLRNSQWRGGPVLLVWPDAALLRQVQDHYFRPAALCVVPGYRGDHIDTWIAATSATDISGVEAAFAKPSLGDPVVEVAFEHLTKGITLHTGLVSSFAKTQAVETMTALRAAGYTFDPRALEAWAMAHGWGARHASDLREMAERLLAGRRYRVGPRMFKPNIVGIWREEAAARE